MISSRVVYASASIEGHEDLFFLVDNKPFGLVLVVFHYLKNQICIYGENTEIGLCNEMRKIHSSRYRLKELVPLFFFYSYLFFSTLV